MDFAQPQTGKNFQTREKETDFLGQQNAIEDTRGTPPWGTFPCPSAAFT